MQRNTALAEALELMKDLRARCDWDAAQTHESLRPYLIEEAHEVDDAIRSGSDRALKEELGDLLLQVLFHSVVAEERGAFDFSDVVNGFIVKMKSRHPHLYEGGDKQNWEAMKAKKRESIADGLPLDLPSLHRAFRLQDRAAGLGFDWPDAQGPANKVEEELAEVRVAAARDVPPPRHGVPDPVLEDELGDLLFSVVNLCRKLGVHPSLALDKANGKFIGRMQGVEALAKERAIELRTSDVVSLNVLWDEVKTREK